MPYGFEFSRRDLSVLFDTNWPVLTFESKGSRGNLYNQQDPAVLLNTTNRLEAYVATSGTNGTVYSFSTAARTPTHRSGFQFLRPDGRLILSSEFPPMKVVGFRRVTEANMSSQGITVPAGKAYGIVGISTTVAGEPINITHVPPQPPTYEEYWEYQWRNYAIRPVWSGQNINFQGTHWSDGEWYESISGTIQPVDVYLKYDCMIVDVTGL